MASEFCIFIIFSSHIKRDILKIQMIITLKYIYIYIYIGREGSSPPPPVTASPWISLADVNFAITDKHDQISKDIGLSVLLSLCFFYVLSFCLSVFSLFYLSVFQSCCFSIFCFIFIFYFCFSVFQSFYICFFTLSCSLSAWLSVFLSLQSNCIFRSGAPLWITFSVCLSVCRSHFFWNPYILYLIHFTDILIHI